MKKRLLYAASIALTLFITIVPFSGIRAQFCSTEQRAQMDSATMVMVCPESNCLPASTEQCAVTTPLDIFLADKILMKLQPYSGKSVPQLMIMAASMLIGTPYVAGTLEDAKDANNERLRINLHQTDCIIFVETCFNLALAAHNYGKSCTFSEFAMLERSSRYRKGVVDGYPSRLHYTTEWIRQNEENGNLKDITMELGGEVYNHPIFFMSRNYKRYKQMAAAYDTTATAAERAHAKSNLDRISQTEETLNRQPITYIPKDKVDACLGKIKSGDIICYMSGTPGLDIAHVTIAYVENGRVGFVHASMADMKVEIDKMTISEYVKSRKSITGIKVVRPLSNNDKNN